MNRDNHLIFESFERRARTQRVRRIFAEGYQYDTELTAQLVEQILIEEGLMGTLGNLAGKAVGAAKTGVQNIAQTVNDKMLQPVIQKAIEWLKANDPDTLVKVTTAAQEGPQALDQALDEEGAGQVENQIANSPEPQTVNEGVDEYKEMIREHILYLHNEGLLGNIAKGLGKVGTAIGKGAKKAGQAIATGAKDAAGGFKQGYNDQQAQAQQTQAPDVANKPMPAGQLDPNNPTDAELQQYDDNENQKIDGSQQAGDSSEKYRMGHDRIFGNKEEQPAAAGGEKQGMMKKIMGWVKENPNLTKTAAVGILGAASLAMGAALPMIIARYGAGFAAAGGLAGFQKYKELRAQGLEPMEALKQTATDKDVLSRGHTGGAVGVGLGALGDGISKVSSMMSGAGGGGDAATQPAQPGATAPAQPAQPQMNWDVNGDGIPDATPSWKMAGAPTIKEDILWRPGWANRPIN